MEGPTFVQTGVNPEILVSLEPLVGLWCQRRPQIKVYSTFHKSQFFLPPSCQAPGPFWRGLPLFPLTDCSPKKWISSLLPNRPAPRRPPPAGVFTGLNLKSGFWGRLGGVIPCSRGLVGTSGARSFHLGHNIFSQFSSPSF